MDVQMFFCAATVVSQWLTLRRSNPKAPKICHESKTACWEDLSLITQLKHAVDEAINDLRNDSFSTSSHNLVQHQTFEFIMWGIRLPNAFLLTSPLMFQDPSLSLITFFLTQEQSVSYADWWEIPIGISMFCSWWENFKTLFLPSRTSNSYHLIMSLANQRKQRFKPFLTETTESSFYNGVCSRPDLLAAIKCVK